LSCSPCCSRRPGRIRYATATVCALFLFSILGVFWLDIFPDCFVPGQGLTSFKVGAEYTVILLLAASAWLLRSRSNELAPTVRRLLFVSIGLTATAELAFTLYSDVYGITNAFGHIFKALSCTTVALALIHNSVREPLGSLYRQLTGAEQALSRSNANWHLLAGHLEERIYELSSSLVIRDSNESSAKGEQIVGRPYLELIPEDQRAAVHADLQAVLRDGLPRRYEVRLPGTDLPPRIREQQAVALVLDGLTVGITIVSRDITFRRRETEAYRAIERIREDEGTTEPDPFLAALLREALTFSSAQRVRLRSGALQLLMLAAHGENDEILVTSVDPGQDETSWKEFDAEHAGFDEMAWSGFGPGSWLAVPLLGEGSPKALLIFEDLRFRPERDYVSPLERLVTDGWRQYANLVTSRHLDEQRQQLANLLVSLPGMAFRREHDPAWSLSEASPGAVSLTGYSPTELTRSLVDLSFGDLIHDEDRERAWIGIEDAIRHGDEYQVHYRIRTKIGSLRWVQEQGLAVRNEAGDLIGLEGYISNIDAAKLSDENEQRSHQIQERERQLRTVAMVTPVMFREVEALMMRLEQLEGSLDTLRESSAARLHADRVRSMLVSTRKLLGRMRELVSHDIPSDGPSRP
jgi:PAS domain S-box-containing protein